VNAGTEKEEVPDDSMRAVGALEQWLDVEWLTLPWGWPPDAGSLRTEADPTFGVVDEPVGHFHDVLEEEEAGGNGDDNGPDGQQVLGEADTLPFLEGKEQGRQSRKQYFPRNWDDLVQGRK